MCKQEFNIPTRVLFRPEDEETFTAGIAYKDIIICSCCGGIFQVEDIPDVYPYENWANFHEAISDEPPEDFPLDAEIT